MPGRKAAIITGSGTGVGAATALALARRGYDVLINYSRSESEARACETACREAGADTLIFCKLAGTDVTAVVRERHAFRPGETIKLAPELTFLFDPSTGARVQ